MKINIRNEAKVTEAISAVEGKCSVNLIDADEMKWIANEAEIALRSLSLPQKDWAGAVFCHHNAGPAKSYKYMQGATEVTIERFASGWFLTDVRRIEIFPQEKMCLFLRVTQAQKDMAVARFASTIAVLQALKAVA